VEIDQLLETKKALEQSADLKAEESRVVEDVLSSGGSIGITMREGRRQFQIDFTSMSQTAFSVREARNGAEPIFPFVKQYTHGTSFLGDSMLEASKSKDITLQLRCKATTSFP